jgi:hypothetical protein
MIELFGLLFADLDFVATRFRLLAPDDRILVGFTERSGRSKTSGTDKVDDRVKFLQVILKWSSYIT